MSRTYDNWEKLVGAVLKREELRRIALCESLSSSISADFSFDASLEDVPADSRNSCKTFNPAASSSQSIFFARNVKAIQYEEIKKATKNFQPDMMIGKGRFGPVFKGWIHKHFLTAVKPGSGIAVAVKMVRKGAFQGHREWSKEINYLSQLHHPNLVKLIGYCFEKRNRILVYEFIPKGSLGNHLFRGVRRSLSWATRIKVAVGAARGLSFLHDSAIPVILRGFHTNDILLDGELNAKLSNFGFASNSPTGPLTTDEDVFVFGIFLLELLSGLQVINTNRRRPQLNLVECARPYLGSKRKLLRIINSILNQYPHNGAYKVAKLALQCVSREPKLRPSMAEVVATLDLLQCPKTV